MIKPVTRNLLTHEINVLERAKPIEHVCTLRNFPSRDANHFSCQDGAHLPRWGTLPHSQQPSFPVFPGLSTPHPASLLLSRGQVQQFFRQLPVSPRVDWFT